MTYDRMSNGNRKLRGNGVLIFNLPAIKSCRNCRDCAKTCYARKAEWLYPQVLAFREENLDMALNNLPELYRRLHAQITRKFKRVKDLVVRIHESGDFVTQEYLDRWVRLAQDFPEVHFWAYTKTKDSPYSQALLDFTVADSLPNLNIINSYIDGQRMNYGPREYVDRLMAEDPECFLCPAVLDHSIACSSDCKLCVTGKKPVFYKH